MADKNNENRPGQKAGPVPEGSGRRSEFDEAVTTAISDVIAKALDGDQAVGASDVHVTDMQLAVHVDVEADEVLEPGFLLNDRFEIVELVHGAGMGQVYKAIDLRRHPEGSGEVHVAIKMMRPSVASDEEARLALEREAAKAQSLSHPNIINIFDFDHHDGRFFLVMEWLEGESVNALLRRTSGDRIAPNFVWPVIEGAAAGVQYAHQKNVVHADINPSNIFITDTQDIKLLDFGVARYTSNPEEPEDDDRMAWVTQTYASPEVLSGLTPVVADDVFSLACVTYRLLAGKHPFGGVPSLVAKHKDIAIDPVPGLGEAEWHLLRRALSYERSDRPASVGEFVSRGVGPTETAKSASRPYERIAELLLTPWAAAAAAAAVIILAGALWLFQRGTDVESALTADATIAGEPAAAEAVESQAVSRLETLVAEGTQALFDGRLVAPDESSARSLFRQALLLEPDNVEALRGLRAISDDYVQTAQRALNSDDPIRAYDALTIATETDPGNPAIGMVSQLLAARGNSEFADARLAAATGDIDLAALLLSRAEQYRNIDPAAVQSLRQQMAESRSDSQFLNSLAAVDAHVAAGRLLAPEGDNAHALLLDLYERHGDESRLRASMERLGERLLTRAAFAAAGAEIAEATELLDAVDTLRVLAPEVEAARISLEAVAARPEPEDPASLQIAGEQAGDVPFALPGDDTTLDEQPGSIPGDVPTIVAASLAPATTGEAVVPQEPESRSAVDGDGARSAGNGNEARVARRTVQEFGIETYVAPKFPRAAQRRGLTGFVDVGFMINADGSIDSIQVVQSEPGDVFAQSAIDAVRKWEFVPRDEPVRARIRLRFDMEP